MYNKYNSIFSAAGSSNNPHKLSTSSPPSLRTNKYEGLLKIHALLNYLFTYLFIQIILLESLTASILSAYCVCT